MKLTEAFLSQYKDRPVHWGYGDLGYVVYRRTYSRPTEEGHDEEWWETVRRVVTGVYSAQFSHCEKNGLPWSAIKSQISAQRMYDLIFNFKFVPPGRGLWAMGTEYVRSRGSAALNNCAFISTENLKQDFAHPFCWLMDMSMLGVGVGSDTRGAGTVTIKEPEYGERFTVEDSREGWVESVRTLLSAFIHKSKLPSDFDYSSIRPSGHPVRGFGGVCTGYLPLQELHRSLESLLRRRIGSVITSSDIVDIFNLIGKAVVSGGIRRTAEIMLGFPGDDEFLRLKDPKLHGAELANHRWASNNSLIVDVGTDYSPYIDQIMGNGEPGMFWIDNARTYGRMKDPIGDHDPHVLGMNPCGEIALESNEFCNLVEVCPARHDTWEELQTTLKWAYLYAKTVSLMPTHDPQTNAVIGRNRRLGISVTGITQALRKHGIRKLFNMLDQGYRYLRDIDRLYSKWLCVPESIKLTTVKPSGTVSLLTGDTPGVHFPHAEHYIRNVRFDVHSPLLPSLREAGYRIEPSVAGDNTFVVSFPVKEQYFTKGKADVTAREQFELAAQMQHWWADNSVSVTVTAKESERKELADIISMYETRMKSVSILPLREHGYEQAPYIEITEAEFDAYAGNLKMMQKSVTGAHDIDETGCTGDVCSII